jgi:methionyl-tRNA synthetase
MKKKFYITTAIDYPNAEPHIGHAYQKIVADVLSRWHTILGEDVRFLTGTDEHGKKIQEAAEKKGKAPREFVDELAMKFKQAWKTLNIKPDRFIRTTDSDHEELVKKIIEKCNDNGDIYKGEYEGLYCTDCEAYYTEKDLGEGNLCPVHKRPVKKIKEESYFFKLSKYKDFLLELYEKNPEFIKPEERRNEIISRVKEGLKDLSISRTSFDWGVPFPLDEKHITYVWFDALFNYYTGSGENKEYWPANVHLLGKDNSWFHCVYWPAFLKSAGLELPKTVFVHGFLSFNGQKISKSLGNAISPNVLSEKYGADSIRYFVCRQFPFAEGNDGNFSEEYLIERHNNELANKLGNLVSRTISLINKKGISKNENTLIYSLDFEKIKKDVNEFQLDKILNSIFAFIDVCNEYIQEKRPWEADEDEAKKVLYRVADSIKKISILLWPFIPETSEKIAKQFGDYKLSLEEFSKQFNENSKIEKKDVLFNKLDKENFLKEIGKDKKEKINKSPQVNEVMENVGQVKFEDWEKLDLLVAEIKNVEEVEGADKLWKLTLDVGTEIGGRIVCAGLKQFYPKEKLQGKKIIYFANLKPRKMRGIESQGMLLAASTKEHDKVVLISPEEDIENGSIVG